MDSQIKSHFKNKRFASLEYLSSKEVWAQDINNLGLYFFLLDSTGKDTSEIFKKILETKGTLASSCKFLGKIASKLFDQKSERQIATYYFTEAIKHDDQDTDVLWKLYCLTNNYSYFIKAINLDYQNNRFELISNNLRGVYSSKLVDADFDKSEWQQLREICRDERVSNSEDLIMISSFYLEELADGVRVMHEKELVSKNIVDLYLNKECINLEYAIRKVYDFQRPEYIKNDPKRLYEEIKKEAKKGNANPTVEAQIKYAFEASEYNDVISLIGEYESNSTEVKVNNECKLYHILSSLHLGIDINEGYENSINKQNFFRESNNNTSCNPLYLAYLIHKKIKELEAQLDIDDQLHLIENWAPYKEAEEYLSHDSLLNHYLHDSLMDMLKSLKDKWDLKMVHQEISTLKSISQLLSESDSCKLASHLIETKEYEEATSLLLGLSPNMSIANMLGVCYERQGNIKAALKEYKSAIDSMKSSGELNEAIISNYLSCLERSDQSIPDSSYCEYIDDFNNSIASYFQYNLFKPQNRRSLFKYYPLNKFTLDALVNGYFYLAASSQLNDPIELPYNNLNIGEDNSFLRPNFRLSSFSNNENSMLMWSHYAENHTGVMVEYCFEGFLPKGVGIEEVSYSNTTKRYKEKEHYIFNQYMLTKNKDWSYEKEVRLFAYKRDKVYYKKASYPNKENNKAHAYIRSITVGYKFPKSTIKLIQSIIASLNEERDKDLAKIELRVAKLSEKNFFELEYEIMS